MKKGKPNLVSPPHRSPVLLLCLRNQLPLLENLVEVLLLSLNTWASETFLLNVSGARVGHPERWGSSASRVCVFSGGHTPVTARTHHRGWGAVQPLGAPEWKGSDARTRKGNLTSDSVRER